MYTLLNSFEYAKRGTYNIVHLRNLFHLELEVF